MVKAPFKIHLRKLDSNDTGQIINLANDRQVTDEMISLPYPFEKKHALKIIGDTKNMVLGIEELATKKLAGVVTLRDLNPVHLQVELSLWIGITFWGKGYATETCKQALEIAFNQLKANRVYGFNMCRNEKSGRMMSRIGMKREGLLRQRVLKNGKFEDVYINAILEHDWQKLKQKG